MSDDKDLVYVKRVQAMAKEDPQAVIDCVSSALATHDGRHFKLMSDKNKHMFRERAKVCMTALDKYFARLGEEE